MERNVILIIMDSVRKDFFDKYSPRINSRFDLSFEQCRAASSWSVPSHASILTGDLPHQHGIHSYNLDFADIDHSNTFISDLPSANCVAISSNPFVSSKFGFEKHFDDVIEISTSKRFKKGGDIRDFTSDLDYEGIDKYISFIKYAINHSNTTETVVNAIAAQLNATSRSSSFPKLLDEGAKPIIKEAKNQSKNIDEPFFLFLNIMDTHSPYQHMIKYNQSLHDASYSWTSRDEVDQWEINTNSKRENMKKIKNYRDLYSASIDYADRQVARFIDQVDQITDGQTTIVVTSDHGENLAFPSDNNLIGHKSSLTEGLLHVPLGIINPPGDISGEEDGLVSHLQLGLLLVQLSKGKLPTIATNQTAAELIGTIKIPSLYDENYWKRMIRCIYDMDSQNKSVWDSLGNSQRYMLEKNKPNWQRLTSDSKIPDWPKEFFDIPIDKYKEKNYGEENITNSSHDHLKDLGYL